MQRFKTFSADLVDDGKRGFVLNFYTQVSCRQWKVFFVDVLLYVYIYTISSERLCLFVLVNGPTDDFNLASHRNMHV